MAETVETIEGEILIKVGQAIKGLDDVNARLDALAIRSEKTTSLFGPLGKKLAAVFAVRQVVEFGKDVFEATNRVEELNEAFELAAGSSNAAAQEMSFVDTQAQRLGLSVEVLRDSYLGLFEAGKAAGFQSQTLQQIFSSVTGAGNVLNKSTDDIAGTLQMLEKMMLKGEVTGRELTAGLGMKMPQALKAMADAMGVSVEGLKKMADNGQLVASQVLPAMAAQLEKTFGGKFTQSGESAEAQINKLKTAFNNLFVHIGESGFLEWLADAAKQTAKWVNIVADKRLQDFSKNVFTTSDALESQSVKLRDATFRLIGYEQTIARMPKNFIPPGYAAAIEKTRAEIEKLTSNLGTLEAKVAATSKSMVISVFGQQQAFDSWRDSIVTSADATVLFNMQMSFLEQKFKNTSITASQFAAESIAAAEALTKTLGIQPTETAEAKDDPNAIFFAQQEERANFLATSLLTEEELIKISMENRLLELQNAAVLHEEIAQNEAEIELRIRRDAADQLAQIEAEKLKTEINTYGQRIQMAQTFGSALLTLTGAGAKKQNKLQKTFAIANGLLSAYESIMAAYNAGAKINPYVGAAFAAAAAITQFATLSKMQSVEPGSGGGSASAPSAPSVPGGGGGGVSSGSFADSDEAGPVNNTVDVNRQRNVAQQNLTVVLQGQTFSDEQVVELMERTAELSRNGRVNLDIQRSF